MGSMKDFAEKNNVTVFNTVSKLVDTLREKLAENAASDEIRTLKKIVEFDELKKLCSNDDPLLSLTACQGLVSLVQSNSISVKYALIVLLGILVGEKNIRGITSAVLNILVLDLRAQLQENNVYKNPIPSLNQHPLCRLLIQNPNSWRDILNQMSSVYFNHYEIVSEHALELLKPLFKFILMESADAFSEICRQQTWKLLVEKAIDSDKEFIFTILSTKYFQSGIRDPLEIAGDISVLCHVSKSDENMRIALILIMTALIHDVIKSCYDPSSILRQLKLLLETSDGSLHTVVLIMLSHSITVCPAFFLHQILDFCEWLVKNGQCSADSIWMLVVASLSWLNCISPILAPAHNSIKNILAMAQVSISSSNKTQDLVENKLLSYVVSRNWKISQAIQLSRLCGSLRMSDNRPLQWLTSIPHDMISEVYLLIGALMIGQNGKDIRLKAVNTIKNAPASLASRNLTLILYQLGREKEPDCQLAILRALVTTAIDKSNISSIIFTLKTLQKSNEPHLQMMAVDLYLRLWDIEERCYPFLLTALTEDREQFNNSKFSRQMDIACAAGFRHICEKMPEKHGKELVKPIQNLLIKCQGSNGVIASSFLIQALASLVKARVLSASSTWKQLYPLTEDMQSAVCASFCELIEACLQNSCEEDVVNSMCSWLWKLVGTYKATFVVNAALRALKKFSVHSMKLSLIPANFRRNVKLPARYAKSPATANRRPEDVLEFVPGSVWVEFLQNVRNECKDLACELLAHWLEVEVVKFRGGFYDVTFGEPKDYEKLPDYSVCRGLVDNLRCFSGSVTPETDMKVQKMIFQVLSFDRLKPLPPINWSFLSPYIEHPDVKVLALTLAAKESKGSLSARACIENYINVEPHNDEKDVFLYALLSDLARGVPPKTLQNLIGRTLKKAFTQKENESMKLYLKHIATTLADTEIHDANRTMFCQNLKAIWEEIVPECSVIEDVILCAVNLPISQVESMSSVSVMWEVTPEKLRKAIKLRCGMALADNSETPFTWLNECIENVASHIVEQQYLLMEVEKILEKKYGHETAWPWLEELIGQMLQTACNHEPGLDLMFSIFLLSVDFISKFSILYSKENLKERLIRFPHAFHSLLIKEKVELNKVAEKLKYLSKTSVLSSDHKTALNFVISALS